MKVIINQSNLLEGLKIVARAVSGANTLPVLSNILLRAEGRKLFLSSTDLEISICTWVEATVKNEGSITIPAKILTSYISLLDKGAEVELKLMDGMSLEIRSTGSKTKIKGLSADEFPKITLVESTAGLAIDLKTFRQTVGEVAFASKVDSSRPILSAILFVVDKDNLTVVGTDSFRLSEKSIKLKKSLKEFRALVPVRSFLEADRLASFGAEGDLVITISDNQVMFEVGNTKLISRLIEGNFPDYHRIIPKSHRTTVLVDREELALAVRRVSIFAKENNDHMRLDFLSDETLVLSTEGTQIGEGRATLPVKLSGAPNVMALNAEYVLHYLSAVSGAKNIEMELEGKLVPAVFRKEGDRALLHLIMPLKM